MPKFFEKLYNTDTQKICCSYYVEKEIINNQEYLLWYLYGTLLCRACITTKEFELYNDGWQTAVTCVALSNIYKFYIMKNYKLTDVFYTGGSYLPNVIRGYVIAKRRGYNVANIQQKIPCIHYGKYEPIKRMGENDTIIIHPDKINNVVSVRPYVNMRGTSLKQIIESTNTGKFPFDVEIIYNTEAPEYCYASWIYKDIHYLFRLRLQSTRWNATFTEQVAVYVATNILKVDENSSGMMFLIDIDKIDASIIQPLIEDYEKL